jgi:hypothetical protein
MRLEGFSMTELVALATIIGTVAIVAIIMNCPFRGRANGQGVELEAGTPSTPRANKTRTRKKR